MQAGAGRWVVSSSQIRLTVTGRARRLGLKPGDGGERREAAVVRSLRPRSKLVMAGQSSDEDGTRTLS